jgi:hypothetical protein
MEKQTSPTPAIPEMKIGLPEELKPASKKKAAPQHQPPEESVGEPGDKPAAQPVAEEAVVEKAPEEPKKLTPADSRVRLGDVHAKLQHGLQVVRSGQTSVAIPANAAAMLPGFNIAYHPLPEVSRVGILHDVMVYATVTVERGGKLVTRLYAHLPPHVNAVIQAILKESGIRAEISPDSHIKASFL